MMIDLRIGNNPARLVRRGFQISDFFRHFKNLKSLILNRPPARLQQVIAGRQSADWQAGRLIK